MRLGKKFLAYGLIGFFCISLWASEKKIQKNGILEKYWLIRQVSQEQGCPEELSKEIMNYAECTDEEMMKIKKLVHIVKDDLPDFVIRRHIFKLNEQQQEGLLCLIENRKRGAASDRRKIFTPDQYAKMKDVPFVFKMACDEQHALVQVPEPVVRCEERIEGLVNIALLSIAGGITYSGIGLSWSSNSAVFYDQFYEPIKMGAYKCMMLGAGMGAIYGSLRFAGDEMDRIQYGARNKNVVREQMLFEQPRLPELDKDYMKKLGDLEKKWDQWG